MKTVFVWIFSACSSLMLSPEALAETPEQEETAIIEEAAPPPAEISVEDINELAVETVRSAEDITLEAETLEPEDPQPEKRNAADTLIEAEPVIEESVAPQLETNEPIEHVQPVTENPAQAAIEPIAETENEDTARATPPMWRLVDEDSEVWLLGTFHILPPGLDWRSDALANAIDAADTIYFEAEVDTPEAQQQTLQKLMTEGFLPKGEALSAKLSETDAAKLKEVSSELGLPIAAVDTMRPWQAFLNLTVQYIVSKGFDPGSGVETILLKEARLRDRQLGFFETVEQQISLFTSLKPEIELELLKITLQDWDEQDEQFQALFKAWRTGDVQAIDALMNDTMRMQTPEVYEALLVKRNEAWASQIKGVMAGDGKILIAVGAGHLVGDKSVPAMLREYGFDVARYGVEE